MHTRTHTHTHTHPVSLPPCWTCDSFWLLPRQTALCLLLFRKTFTGSELVLSLSTFQNVLNIFKSTLGAVYLCWTTIQWDLWCHNLKRASPFLKIKQSERLQECKLKAAEIIQIQIATPTLASKMFSLKSSAGPLEICQESTPTYLLPFGAASIRESVLFALVLPRSLW